MRWRVLREEAESHYGGLWKVYRDFVKVSRDARDSHKCANERSASC